MMEFTLARVVMVLCGIVMLAAIVPPVSTIYDNGESAEMQEQTELFCRMLDSFYTSEADEMTLCLCSVLPQHSSVSVDGYLVTISDGENDHIYNTEYRIINDKGFYSSNDYVRITKGDSVIMMDTLSD